MRDELKNTISERYYQLRGEIGEKGGVGGDEGKVSRREEGAGSGVWGAGSDGDVWLGGPVGGRGRAG